MSLVPFTSLAGHTIQPETSMVEVRMNSLPPVRLQVMSFVRTTNGGGIACGEYILWLEQAINSPKYHPQTCKAILKEIMGIHKLFIVQALHHDPLHFRSFYLSCHSWCRLIRHFDFQGLKPAGASKTLVCGSCSCSDSALEIKAFTLLSSRRSELHHQTRMPRLSILENYASEFTWSCVFRKSDLLWSNGLTWSCLRHSLCNDGRTIYSGLGQCVPATS